MRDPLRMGQTSTKKGPVCKNSSITLPIPIFQVYPMMGDIVRMGPICNQDWPLERGVLREGVKQPVKTGPKLDRTLVKRGPDKQNLRLSTLLSLLV